MTQSTEETTYLPAKASGEDEGQDALADIGGSWTKWLDPSRFYDRPDMDPSGTREKSVGTPDADRLAGDASDDALYGRAGADALFGRGGADSLRGNGGADALYGGGGADELIGGGGNDSLTGGAGADSFVFKGNAGHDRITDFQSGKDTIDVTALGCFKSGQDFLAATQDVDGNAVVTLSDTASITLVGVSKNDLDASDFLAGFYGIDLPDDFIARPLPKLPYPPLPPSGEGELPKLEDGVFGPDGPLQPIWPRQPEPYLESPPGRDARIEAAAEAFLDAPPIELQWDSFHFSSAMAGDGCHDQILPPLEDLIFVENGVPAMLWDLAEETGTHPAGHEDLTLVGIAGIDGSADDPFAL